MQILWPIPMIGLTILPLLPIPLLQLACLARDKGSPRRCVARFTLYVTALCVPGLAWLWRRWSYSSHPPFLSSSRSLFLFLLFTIPLHLGDSSKNKGAASQSRLIVLLHSFPITPATSLHYGTDTLQSLRRQRNTLFPICYLFTNIPVSPSFPTHRSTTLSNPPSARENQAHSRTRRNPSPILFISLPLKYSWQYITRTLLYLTSFVSTSEQRDNRRRRLG